MKPKIGLLLAPVLAATASAAEGRADVRDLPPGVQQTLERWRAEGPVKQVTRQVDGRNVYFIEIEKNNAPNPRLKIAEDGTLIREPIPTVSATGDGVPLIADEYGAGVVPILPKLRLSDLPANVQQTARTEATGREIVDIDRETWNGRPVYEIEFKERGLNSRVYLDHDGAVVRDERRPGPALKSLFMGTQLSDTPSAVQAAVRRAAGDREVIDIDRKTGGARRRFIGWNSRAARAGRRCTSRRTEKFSMTAAPAVNNDVVEGLPCESRTGCHGRVLPIHLLPSAH